MKLGDVCTKIGSGATPRGGKESYKSTGMPLIRSQNVLDFSFSSDGLAFIDDDQAQLLNNVTVQENDVLINITGDSVARTCMVPTDYVPARVNQHVAIIRANTQKSNPDYLLYLLQFLKPHLLSIGSSGGTRNALTKQMLENLEFPFPSLPEQIEIGRTLRTLDDKIAINNKINHHLEQIASAVFDEVFSTSAVPDVGNLSMLIEFKNGKSRPMDAGVFPVYGGNGILSYTSQNNAENVIIIGRVGAYCGSIYLEPGSCWVSDNAIYAKSKLTDKEYFDYFLLQGLALGARHIGTSQPLLTQGILNAIEVTVPTTDSIKAFNEVVTPMFERIHLNLAENARLVTLRDALLPRLMSGELSVVDLTAK